MNDVDCSLTMNMDHRFPVLNEARRKILVRWRLKLKIRELLGLEVEKHSTGNRSTSLVSITACISSNSEPLENVQTLSVAAW